MPPEPYPNAPEHLSARAKAIWSAVGPAKVKTGARRVLFQAALESLDSADEARNAILAEGMTSRTETTGAVHVHPLVKIELQHRAMFHKSWCALGLNAITLIDPFKSSCYEKEG